MTSGPDALSLDHIIASIGDFTADAIVISEAQPVTGDGPRILWVNRAFEDMTGYSIDEVVGKTPRVLQGPDTDPDTRQRIRDALQNWQHVREEIKNYRKDGTPFWVELSIQPVADAGGCFRYWVAIQRDTTAQRALQSQLAQAIKLESMGKMTSGIAHDFNNLLAVILGNLELLQMRNEAMRENPLVANAVDAVKKGRSLTHSLLSFARQTELRPTPCDVVELCTDVHAMMLGLLPECIVLELIEPAEPVQALLDRHLFQSALLNLVLNARDAMPGGGRVEVAIRAESAAELSDVDGTAGPCVEVSVTDNGEGIAPDDLASILEPFFTTKAVGQGSGLGLSTVHGFVEQSGGRLLIDSEPGVGTRARMLFPAVQAIGKTTPASTERSPVPQPGRDGDSRA